MDNLSNDARVILGANFMAPGNKLHFGLVTTVPTKQTTDAVQELIDADLIKSRSEPGDGFTLTLSDAGRRTDRRPPGGTSEERFQFIIDHNFEMVEDNASFTGRSGHWGKVWGA